MDTMDTTPNTLHDTDKLSQKLKDIEQSVSNPYVSRSGNKTKKTRLAYKKSHTSIN